jgi:hypothetical protein
LLLGACALATVLAVLSAARQDDPESGDSAAARDVLDDAQAGGRKAVVFRSLDRDRPKARGEVAVATVGGQPAAGGRTLTQLGCDRVYFAAGRGICLARGGGFAAGYKAKIFDEQLRIRHEVPVDGLPSRARVSPDGRYGSVTLFVTGHAYADAGSFSTQTTLIDLARGERIADLEDFTVTKDGVQVTAVDRNFWGVTFAPDSDRFYATMATGGKTYLVVGSVSRRTAHVIHENVECPSLSPDGKRIAYKKRVGSGANPWRLTVLDLSSMRETPLAETRSVDDQAEWLDEEHVLYGIGGEVYVVRADGGGQPRRFLTGAESPAVVSG